MTAIVCQFLWSGIAPSGDDKSQSSGPEYMLKVSCDVLKLSVIYSTTCMLLWWLIITETRDISPYEISVGRVTCLARCW